MSNYDTEIQWYQMIKRKYLKNHQISSKIYFIIK